MTSRVMIVILTDETTGRITTSRKIVWARAIGEGISFVQKLKERDRFG
jgi:hypothetical protein